MADSVVETAPLGAQWPMIDPFLFCAHHDDAYPPGNEVAGPAVSLEGRELGMDFEGIDGWRMYHGREVPGFPNHPHRGFETVTYVRKGLIDHSDSLGAAARFGRGDVQWLTAGGGIVHSEMFPLLDAEQPNPLELFQIWLNLPAEDKLVDAHFSMLWDGDIPRLRDDGVEVTVIAGELAGLTPPPPPPHSWASRPEADVAIWHIVLQPGARWTLPKAPRAPTPSARSTSSRAAAWRSTAPRSARAPAPSCESDVDLELVSPEGTEVLLLQGKPIARAGRPLRAVRDEHASARSSRPSPTTGRRTSAGGRGPPRSRSTRTPAGRFAKRPDGTVEEPAA